MSSFVIEYADGRITGWRYEAADDYTAGEGELVAPDEVHHRNIRAYQLDTSTPPPSLTHTGYTSPKEQFRDARSKGDTQAQLDALFEMVTGEQP